MAASDPFDGLRPEPPPACAEGAFGPEDLSGERVFSVDSADCGYLTVVQPAKVELEVGDTVALRLWHFDLESDAPAVANLGLAFDGSVAWREVLPIPSEAALLEASIQIFDPVAAGEPVHFHVSNHGRNSYSLIAVDLVIP